eukprot:g6445.t1
MYAKLSICGSAVVFALISIIILMVNTRLEKKKGAHKLIPTEPESHRLPYMTRWALIASSTFATGASWCGLYGAKWFLYGFERGEGDANPNTCISRVICALLVSFGSFILAARPSLVRPCGNTTDGRCLGLEGEREWTLAVKMTEPVPLWEIVKGSYEIFVDEKSAKDVFDAHAEKDESFTDEAEEVERESADRAIEEVIHAVGVSVGFAWEQSFDAGVETIGELTMHMGSWYPVWARLAFACMISAVMIPAWRLYLIKKSLEPWTILRDAVVTSEAHEKCRNCGAVLVIDARYCHMCSASKPLDDETPKAAPSQERVPRKNWAEASVLLADSALKLEDSNEPAQRPSQALEVFVQLAVTDAQRAANLLKREREMRSKADPKVLEELKAVPLQFHDLRTYFCFLLQAIPMEKTGRFILASIREFVATPFAHPISAFKWNLACILGHVLPWCFPPFVCFLCFCFQSVMLHMTTAKYVVLSEPHLNPAGDIGHHLLGKQDVDTTLLDAISSSSLLLFVMGAMLLRELRQGNCLGSDPVTCLSLFVFKGTWDWMTVLPDSIGYHECERRLNGDPAKEIWIPRAMIPCCCFNGYYTIKWLEDKEVKLRQDRNKSALWERLTKFSESLVPEQQSTNAEEQRGPNFGTFSDAKDEESRG